MTTAQAKNTPAKRGDGAPGVQVARTIQSEQDVVAIINERRNVLGKVLPSDVPLESFAAVVRAYWHRKENPLFGATPASVIHALESAAQLGIVPDGSLGLGYLVKYGADCTFIPGYRGYVQALLETQRVTRLATRLVYEGETFQEVGGTDPQLVHEIDRTLHESYGKVVAAYAVCQLDGEWHWEVVNRSMLDRVQKVGGPVWKVWPEAMARKTALRQLAKWMPFTPRLRELSRYDAQLDERARPAEVVDIRGPKVAPARGGMQVSDMASAQKVGAIPAVTDTEPPAEREPGEEG